MNRTFRAFESAGGFYSQHAETWARAAVSSPGRVCDGPRILRVFTLREGFEECTSTLYIPLIFSCFPDSVGTGMVVTANGGVREGARGRGRDAGSGGCCSRWAEIGAGSAVLYYTMISRWGRAGWELMVDPLCHMLSRVAGCVGMLRGGFRFIGSVCGHLTWQLEMWGEGGVDEFFDGF